MMREIEDEILIERGRETHIVIRTMNNQVVEEVPEEGIEVEIEVVREVLVEIQRRESVIERGREYKM